jgi:hypothetical protein
MFITVTFANNFVCSIDPVYQKYTGGKRTNLNGAHLYSNELICKQNCRTYSKCLSTKYKYKNGSVVDAYYCPINSAEDLGGDISGNFFSDENDCNSKCYKQKACVLLKETGCKIVDIQYLNPVTDYTGKTVYTARKVFFECNITRTVQTGCKQWEIKDVNGTVDYANTPIYTVWKEYKGANTAGALASLLEQPIHLFSGWKGYCESGMYWSNPFNNPMTILSYAIMVYQAGGKGAFGSNIKNQINKINSKFDKIANKFQEKIDNIANNLGISSQESEIDMWLADEYNINTVDYLKKFEEINTIDTFKIFGEDVTLYYTDLAKIALAGILENPEEYEQKSNKFIQTWMGDTYDANDAALNYVKCMDSIGLSFPNLASRAMGDVNSTSEALKNVFENPLSLTKEQLGILSAATSPKYVATLYKVVDYDDNLGLFTLVAATPNAYYQAGQVICGGILAVTNNALMNNTSPDEADNSTASNIGKAAIKVALSKMPPPYNIMASLAFDIISAISKGDACHDEKTAIQWGLIQLKTNKFLNFNQCHYISKECSWKLNLGFTSICLRHKYNYCCYDQILTRIFAEAIKAESGKGWDKCNDITINDFKNISFRKCEPGENPYPYNCFPADKYDEFVKYLQKQGIKNTSLEDAAQQVINSLAIPQSNCCNCSQ